MKGAFFHLVDAHNRHEHNAAQYSLKVNHERSNAHQHLQLGLSCHGFSTTFHNVRMAGFVQLSHCATQSR